MYLILFKKNLSQSNQHFSSLSVSCPIFIVPPAVVDYFDSVGLCLCGNKVGCGGVGVVEAAGRQLLLSPLLPQDSQLIVGLGHSAGSSKKIMFKGKYIIFFFNLPKDNVETT